MQILEREALQYLVNWFSQAHRKPLIIRGARQVGKSTLVKLFAQSQHLDLLTLDFEKTPENADLFASNEPRNIINLLNIKFAMKITPGKTLLFLDEVQKTPQVLHTLRYFYEELPELAII
jgi:predicted AAA+ superfamily ATPase